MIVAHENEDYETAKKLWKKIQKHGHKLNDILADFAKASYYDTIADSSKNKSKKKKYQLKVKEIYETIGDSILLLFVEAWIKENPEDKANYYKQAADALNKAGAIEAFHAATAWYYVSLSQSVEEPEDKVNYYKQAANEFKKAGAIDSFHGVTAQYYVLLAESIEKSEDKAEYYKQAADELKKAGDADGFHIITAQYYDSLAKSVEKPEDKANYYKQATDELKKLSDANNFHVATAQHYVLLAESAEEPEDKANYYKQAADELKKAGDADNFHMATAMYYDSLVQSVEKHEDKANYYKQAANEFKKSGDTEAFHAATAQYYGSLSQSAEKHEDKAKHHKQAADEFQKAGVTKAYHAATAWYYFSLVESVEKLEEKAEYYKQASEEFKKAGDNKSSKRVLTRYYFSLSLGTQNEEEVEKYQHLAAKETDLGWLYLTQIAFSDSKKSKESNAHLLRKTIEFYKNYLKSKNEKFPVSSIYLCGDITKKSASRIKRGMSEFFKFNITSYPRGSFKNSQYFKEEIKKNDFVLMVVDKNINDELLYELGVIAGVGKPIIILTSEKVQTSKRFVKKIATTTSDKELAFTALKLFSVIKSGESLEIEDESEKSAIEELMQGFKEKPLFIPDFEFGKKLRGLHEVRK